MNSNTNPRRTSTSVRRAVPALAIVVLAIGLGACQTPGFRAAVPQAPVIQPAEVPAGIDTSRPADRIVEALEAQAKQQAQSPAVRYQGLPADRIDDAQLREQAATDRFDGIPADRIEEQLTREAAGAPVYY